MSSDGEGSLWSCDVERAFKVEEFLMEFFKGDWSISCLNSSDSSARAFIFCRNSVIDSGPLVICLI